MNYWMQKLTKHWLLKFPSYTPNLKSNTSNLEKKLKFFLPAIGWGILITILSLMPGSSFKDFQWSNILNIDKIGHVVFYGVFTFLISMAYYSTGNPIRKSIVFAAVIAILYGFLLELLQVQISEDRFFEMLDLIANIIGSIVGSIAVIFLHKKKRLWIFPFPHLRR